MPARISLSTRETPPSGFCLSNPIYVKIHTTTMLSLLLCTLFKIIVYTNNAPNANLSIQTRTAREQRCTTNIELSTKTEIQ